MGEETELKTKLAVLELKIKLQQDRQEQLVIRAPIDGVVTSWDVKKTLYNRPVMTGQVMMEIADLTAPFFLDLELPEKREGHLDAYVADEKTDELEVTYILATNPDQKKKAILEVTSISERAEPNEEHGAVIKMHSLPDQESLLKLNPRPGAKVIADVHCGRASAGFVYLHEVYEWLHKFFF